MNTFRFVCATKLHRDKFYSDTALGRSLTKLGREKYGVLLFDENTVGLPRLYNLAIEMARSDPAILVFVHDDVYLADIFWQESLLRGLESFQMVGLAGNKVRMPRQASWDALDETGRRAASENLTGGIVWGHDLQNGMVQFFGSPGQDVKMLDGVLLSCRSEMLIETGLRFDEKFDFHFYDVDFCREAERLNVTMGTIPLTACHMGSNTFGTAAWREAYFSYLAKWTD